MRGTMRIASVIAVAALSTLFAGCLNSCSDPSLIPQLGYPGMPGDDRACTQKLSLTAEAMRIALTTTAPVTPTVAIPQPSPVLGTGEFPRFSIVAQNVVSGYTTVYVIDGNRAVPLDRLPTAETMGHQSRTSLSPSGDRIAVLTENVAGNTTLWLGESPSVGTTKSLTAIGQGLNAQDSRITGYAWTSDQSIVYSMANLSEGQDSAFLLQYDVGQGVRKIASGAFYSLVGLSADGRRAFVTRRRSHEPGWPDEVWAVLDLETNAINDYRFTTDDDKLAYFDFAAFVVPRAGTRLVTVISESKRGVTVLSPETSVLVGDPDTMSTRSWELPMPEGPLLYVGAFVWHQESWEEFAFVVNTSLYRANANPGLSLITATLNSRVPILWAHEGIVLWNPDTLHLDLISERGVLLGEIILE